MERLARGSGKVESGETFDQWVAGKGFLRLTGLRVTHYDAQVAGVGGAPGETLLFDDGALALKHGAWPWAPEPSGAHNPDPARNGGPHTGRSGSMSPPASPTA